ncbi:iron-containing alcohol dehydrogenase, partial [Pantoea anthophila]
MNINSTVISGYQALNDMRYLLEGVSSAVVVTDRNIEAIPAVQALLGQLREQIPQISVVNSVPPEPSQHDVAALLAALTSRRADMV